MNKTGTSKKAQIQNAILQRTRRNIGLQMTPLIDIIFLLLIFFLVAAKPPRKQSFLPFSLPVFTGENVSPTPIEPLRIELFPADNGFDVQIAAQPAFNISDKNSAEDYTQLMGKIEATLTAQKRYASDPVELICSPKLKWKHLARTYNLFYGTGITDITLPITQPQINPNDN